MIYLDLDLYSDEYLLKMMFKIKINYECPNSSHRKDQSYNSYLPFPTSEKINEIVHQQHSNETSVAIANN